MHLCHAHLHPPYFTSAQTRETRSDAAQLAVRSTAASLGRLEVDVFPIQSGGVPARAVTGPVEVHSWAVREVAVGSDVERAAGAVAAHQSRLDAVRTDGQATDHGVPVGVDDAHDRLGH